MGQLNNRFHYVWYGTCGEHGDEGCKPFVFSENPTQLFDVEMISAFTMGSNNSLKYFRPDTTEGELTTMECGGMYSIVMKPGKSLTIPGATPAGLGTTKNGDVPATKVSFNCESIYVAPTPTPTPFVCIPTNTAKINITQAVQTVTIGSENYTFRAFKTDDEIGIDTSKLESAVQSTLSLLIPSQNFVGIIDIVGLKPSSDTHYIYMSRGDACYRGEVNDSKIGNSGWVIPLELVDGIEPTPTPTPTFVECNCHADGDEMVSISSAIQPYTDGEGSIHTFKAFQTDQVVSFNLVNFASAMASSVQLNYNNGSLAGIIDLTGIKPDNAKFIVKDGGTCYSATATDANKQSDVSWVLTLSVEKTLPSECGESEPPPVLPTPTPTPTPQPPPPPSTSCCEDDYTELNVTGLVNGAPNPQVYTHSTPGLSDVDLLSWIFIPSGKLCVDVTPSGNDYDINAMENQQRVYLSDNPSTQIGVLTKNIRNTDNTIYFTSSDDKCYMGEWIAGEENITLTLQE